MMGLFDHSHCELNCVDYTYQVLVLAPWVLKNRGLPADEQLFFAEAGCSCSPACHGHKVFGQFLKSGESTQFQREDFLGVLKTKHLPHWADTWIADIEKQDNILTIA